jgi:hypothetical protein
MRGRLVPFLPGRARCAAGRGAIPDHSACDTEPRGLGVPLGTRGKRASMRMSSGPSTKSVITRGIASGVAGTVIMTAFQKLIEMPLTKRGESFAPANFAEKITPIDTDTRQGRQRLNYVTHFSLGMMWGAAYGIAALKGLRGQKAVNTVFGVVYTGDVLLNTALGLYSPTHWSKKDLIVDVVDKYVQAQGTGAVFDRVLDPAK